jgi:hypothetical protein
VIAATTASQNVAHVERLWHAMQREGVDAVVRLTDPSCTWRPFGAGGRTLRGHDELRAFFRGLEGEGVSQEARAASFEPVGDCVLVTGSLRRRSARGLEDRQLFWLYRFRDGRLMSAESFKSRAAALAAARPGKPPAGAG